MAPSDDEISCGEENPSFQKSGDDKQCLWHFYVYVSSFFTTIHITCSQAYPGWRRQILFTRWLLPACEDGSSTGDCCKQGPHVLVSKTGYAKKLEAYCGPTPPKFSKTDFEKGKARWLVVFNKTGRDGPGDSEPELELESPTIGYRSEWLVLVIQLGLRHNSWVHIC